MEQTIKAADQKRVFNVLFMWVRQEGEFEGKYFLGSPYVGLWPNKDKRGKGRDIKRRRRRKKAEGRRGNNTLCRKMFIRRLLTGASYKGLGTGKLQCMLYKR